MKNKIRVKVTELPGGIRVVTEKMSSVESVSLGAWFGVGTRNETVETNGVAHLLEHMVFKGTKHRTAQEIVGQIEFVGGHINAYTSREQTAYFARVLRNDIGIVVDVLADILQHSIFDKSELKRERNVILQEIGQAEDTPDDIIFDYFQETAFPDQAVGRPVLGRAVVVSEISRRTVIEFIKDNYSGNRMVFAAAGDIEHEDLVDQVAARFNSLSSTDAEMVDEPAEYSGGDFRQKKDLEQIHLVIGFPGLAYGHQEFYASQVLSMLLGGGMSSRLFQEVREKRGLAYAIHTFTTSFRDGGLIGIYAGTAEHKIQEMLPVISDELNNIGVSDLDREIYRSKVQLKSALLMGREATSNRCEQLASQLLTHGRVKPMEEILQKLDEVDSDLIKKVIKRTLNQPPTLAAIGPISKLEPYSVFQSRF
ncbi:MAG: peptidase M16 [Rhodospirillaceae bacterium]|nr:peptidase M16 [Rhodospirillaceae bacterium]|tara:strand:- start:1643 stop:2911 length:1269 start_codon:yes stop_codon:yes gene_type:complete